MLVIVLPPVLNVCWLLYKEDEKKCDCCGCKCTCVRVRVYHRPNIVGYTSINLIFFLVTTVKLWYVLQFLHIMFNDE